MGKGRTDYFWELFSVILCLAILVALPIAIFSYDAKVAQGYPGRVITIVGRNDARPRQAGVWIVQEEAGWDYTAERAPRVIRVRQGETVTLRITAVDTIHGFSVPDYGIDEKVYPGKISTVTFRADRAGTFIFRCSRYCALGHQGMAGKLIVEQDPNSEQTEPEFQGAAPDLTFEGEKTNPEWLYNFLKRPYRLRPWLAVQMPNFQLSDRDALAVTEHIFYGLRNFNARPLPEKFRFARKLSAELVEAGRRLASKAYFDCNSCHMQGDKKPDGPQEEWAPDLTLAASRLKPDWMVRWFLAPQKIQPGTKMPDYFADADSGPEDILGGDEDLQILALRDWLLSIGRPTTSGGFWNAMARHRDVIPVVGEMVMENLNCFGCHTIRSTRASGQRMRGI